MPNFVNVETLNRRLNLELSIKPENKISIFYSEMDKGNFEARLPRTLINPQCSPERNLPTYSNCLTATGITQFKLIQSKALD